MKPFGNNWKIVILDKELLKWSKLHNPLQNKPEYRGCGPNEVPCGNDCGKILSLGDEVVVVHNRKGHRKGMYCTAQCQRQHLLSVIARDRK